MMRPLMFAQIVEGLVLETAVGVRFQPDRSRVKQVQ